MTEIYYDKVDAQRVIDIYNTQEPPIASKAAYCPLIDINGYAVVFPDQDRLCIVARQLLNMEAN